MSNLESFIRVLDNIPSAEPERKKGKWIPVNERLPEVDKPVLVTAYGRVHQAKMISADGNSDYPLFEMHGYYETTAHSEYTKNRITAWMPLPEAWRGE